MIHANHAGLRQRPFPAVPDSAYYFPATSHEQALSCLEKALARDEGFALLTGAPGIGKTLLAHCLMQRLPPSAVPVVLTGFRPAGPAALLQAMLYDMGIPHEGRPEQELRLAAVDALLTNFKAGGRTVIVVDEAHHLTPTLLEELRLLGNLEARGGKALQVVLLGLPGLLQTLRRPELAALRQRLVARAVIEPLSRDESLEYLIHHLKHVGGQPDELFDGEALTTLAEGARGVPRLLNQAGHQALLLAREVGAECVDVEAALGALEILGLTEDVGSGDDPVVLNEPQNTSGLLPLNGEVESDVEEVPGIAPRRFTAPARPA